MKKFKLFLFAAVLLGSIGLHAGNKITYTATWPLPGYEGSLKPGATTFGPEIYSHEFADGVGTITCFGEITKIGKSAFEGCTDLTSITIPNSVTTIEAYAFWGCSNLPSITIGNSVTTIGEKAFYVCSGLTSITIPASVTSIGETAFEGSSTSLTSIVVASGNPQYDSRDNCNAIIEKATNTLILGCKYTKVPNNITTIGRSAFDGCSDLKDITLPNSVTTIGRSAFWNCKSLTSITIPNAVTTIGINAFARAGLTSITIPASVKEINEHAFWDCTGLTSVTVSWTDAQSIVSINSNVFQGIANGAGPSGATLYVPAGTYNLYKQANVWKDFGNIIDLNWKITYTDSEQLEGLRGILTVGSTVFGPVIKSHTFSNGTGTITCDGTITKIGENAFFECSNMSAINIPNSVTTIEDDAFYWCASLTSITIPPLVTKIGVNAFYECNNMSTINIPNSVTTIEDDAFRECRSLKTVYCYAVTPPKLGNNVFENVPQDLSIYVFNAEAYKKSWTSLVNNIKQILIEEGGVRFEIIDDNKARVIAKDGGYTGNVIIPNQITYQGMNFTVTEIGQRAFQNCTNLTSITIPNSVTTIGKQAFYRCSGLTSITIPQSVTTIEEQAFEGSSTSLTSIVVASGNPKYDSRDNCNAIIEKATNTLILGCKYTKIPNNITTIGRSAFDGCYDLKDLTIPNSVTTIGRSAFWECKNLTSITIPNSVTTIGINGQA